MYRIYCEQDIKVRDKICESVHGNVWRDLHHLVAQHFYLLINALNYFGLNYRPFSLELPEDGQKVRPKHVLALINE
jgi:hypothetical protein